MIFKKLFQINPELDQTLVLVNKNIKTDIITLLHMYQKSREAENIKVLGAVLRQD